jgi:predicted AAA+ superfamily ATPase
MRLLESMRVVVIRATPQVGKSTLLLLLGRHVLDERRDLESVFIHWKSQEERNNLPYDEYLKHEKSRWQKNNTQISPVQS